MEVIGKVKVLKAAQEVSAAFTKREIVITTEEQYPQFISIDFTQDKCDLLNAYKVGDEVKVSINLRGREWVSPQGETKYFNGIQGWRIEKLESTPSEDARAFPSFDSPKMSDNVPADDLPF
jgi:hypothetical protein